MRVLLISDFFKEDVHGGAELVDAVLFESLTQQGIVVQRVRSKDVTLDILEKYDNIIVSNFVMLSEENKNAIQNKRYVIYEHDHKYLTTRNPSYWAPSFIAPKEALTNVEFYKNATAVIAQSKLHADVIRKNIVNANVLNAGCSLWSKEDLSLIRALTTNEKTNSVGILESNNPIKNTAITKQFVNSIAELKQYNKIELHGEYSEFLTKLSTCSFFAFIPGVLETFNRVVLEARMLGVRLLTTETHGALIGCLSEDWVSKYAGTELIDEVEKRQDAVVNMVLQQFRDTRQDIGDITVVLNCYRRPYNLKMQVEALRRQTIAPKQIWLWVNAHEDNKDFDFSELGIDKIFRNDHNWKFYGRFAGALLADTEYVALFDDDTIPGPLWFQNCLDTMKTNEGILGSAGIILKDKMYWNHDRCGWPTQNKEVVRVDLVGHSWFFKRDWLRFLWTEKPPTWDNGEDIQFSYAAQKYGNIQTYCPPHPADCLEMHGSLYGNELGVDSKATSNNNEVSHVKFFSQRDECVQHGLRNGWNTVNEVKL